MNFTLDSITHVMECLKEEYPAKKFIFKPVYITDLHTFFDYPINDNQYRFFFGRLTVNNTPDDEGLSVFSQNQNIMQLDSFSQIELLFQNVETVSLGLFTGQFRGFEIYESK